MAGGRSQQRRGRDALLAARAGDVRSAEEQVQAAAQCGGVAHLRLL